MSMNMKFNVAVKANNTVEQLLAMTDELLASLITENLASLFFYLVILVIILAMTNCCGTYLAIWLHRSCRCRRFRCCFRVHCGDEEQQLQQRKNYKKQQQQQNKDIGQVLRNKEHDELYLT